MIASDYPHKAEPNGSDVRVRQLGREDEVESFSGDGVQSWGCLRGFVMVLLLVLGYVGSSLGLSRRWVAVYRNL